MAGHAHPVAQTVQIVDDLLHRGHDAASRGQGTPHPLEQGLGEREVPGAVGHGGMHECHIGCQWREQPERAERRIDFGESLIGGHGGPGDGAGHHGRQTPGGRFHPLGHRQDRPVLDLDRAGLVGLAEQRVRVVGRKAVARVGRHDLLDEASLEEDAAECPQAGHDEGEPGVLPPELARHLTGPGRPSTVPEHDVDGVARAHIGGDRILQACHRRARPSLRWTASPWPAPDRRAGENSLVHPHSCPRSNLTTVSG